MTLRKCAFLLAISLVVSAGLLLSQSAGEKQPVKKAQLNQIWSVSGLWSGVACDAKTGAIHARGLGRKCIELNAAGETQREPKLPPDCGSLVRFATLSPESKGELLTFDVWGAALHAFDLEGNLLWNYGPQGIDDVWPVDLNGDGIDEIIVGYNGSTGLHALDHQGKQLWKTNAIGNVWHVCGGDLRGEGTRQVISTSAAGKVHVWSDNGQKRRDLDAGCYATMVRAGKTTPDDTADTIFVAGSRLGWGRGETLVALTGDGKKIWSLNLDPAQSHTDSAQIAPNKPWIAVGLRGGAVHVIDTSTGQLLASVKNQGFRPEVNWVAQPDRESPILLVATGKSINAFTLQFD